MNKPHLGKRGRVLLFFGCVDAIIAASLAFPDPTTRRADLYVWLAGIAPLSLWASAWAVTAAILLWQAFCRRDMIGYAAAIMLKVGWGSLCLGGWIVGEAGRGYVSAAIWLGTAALVGTIAGWAEPAGTQPSDGKAPGWTPR